jgi:hypothetical protein
VSKRARFYVVLAVIVPIALAYSRLSSDWGSVAFFAGLAGLITVIGLVGNSWIEFAPDGAFRRRPGT